MNSDQCFDLVKFHGQSGPYASEVSESVLESPGVAMLKDLSASIKSIDAQVLVDASPGSRPSTE